RDGHGAPVPGRHGDDLRRHADVAVTMTTPSGQALKMRLELKQLGQRHAIAQKSMVIPLTAPLDHPQILEGYAATIDLDADRQRFRRYAFGYPLQRNAKNVPLLWRHTSEVA